MIIVGGVYYEHCVFPEWGNYFGSGGRAAAALADHGLSIKLHTFAPAEFQSRIKSALAAYDFEIEFHSSENFYGFSYLHALSKPVWYTDKPRTEQKFTINVKDEVILRFGFMEGDAITESEYAVFDPQSPEPELFSSNGSRTKHLAYVLNESELAAIFPHQTTDVAARSLLRREDAEIVLVKRGVFGVRVVTADGVTADVSAFETARVFKIGSGDVFSAAFCFYWAILRLAAVEAATMASRSAAWYCDTRTLPIPENDLLQLMTPVRGASPRRIYLAAPFFTIAQRWLVEEVRTLLIDLGGDVFSPLHEVGVGKPEDVAPQDLLAVYESAVVLALIDGGDIGTIFEAGYAYAHTKTVIAYSERTPEYQLTMLSGSRCVVETDLTTVLYKAIWASLE